MPKPATITRLTFVRGFAKHAGSVASGAASVVAAGVALYVDAKFARTIYFSVAGFAALAAGYQMWADERLARRSAENYLTRPDLHILIRQCWRWPKGGGPFLLVHAVVANHSVASATVVDFECAIEADGARFVSDGWTNANEKCKFSGIELRSGRTIEVERETLDLTKYLGQFALKRGEHIDGYIEFSFEHLPRTEGELPLTLMLTDAFGITHQHTAEIHYSMNDWIG